MRNVSALVVGTSGTVGSLLAPFWARASAPVLLQYRTPPPDHAPDNCLEWDPDAGADGLARWISANGCPACMIVLAGVTPRSGRDLALNTQIAETCLEACRSVAISRAIVASSSAVYGHYLDRPFSEEDAPCPVNAYGEAKLAMETACARRSTPDMQITCLRIGNVAGADALLAQARGGASADILIDRFDDGGTPLRSYIGPGTLADVLIRLAEYPATLPPVLNVAAPVPVEMGALANAAGLHWRPRATEQAHAQRITLDCTRLWSLLPASPQASDPAEMIAQLDSSRKLS